LYKTFLGKFNDLKSPSTLLETTKELSANLLTSALAAKAAT
jgi:hypothetical protein